MAASRSTTSKKKPAPRRKPAGARRAPAKKRAKRRSGPRQLEQRHVDLIGLGFVALAVFLGFVIYRGRDGGELGVHRLKAEQQPVHGVDGLPQGGREGLPRERACG